jgi:hypothetical protein
MSIVDALLSTDQEEVAVEWLPGLAEEFGADWASQRNAIKAECAESVADGPV